MSATVTSNGRVSAEAHFPLDSFREAAVHLRRPFTPAAVKFKVQATWPKDAPTGGLIVAYIDARLAVERLNLIVPHLWHDTYEQMGARHLLCKLTVDGITRQDVGEGEGKGLYSDALKRAAVKFGVGVSLYAIPQMRLDKQGGALKDVRTKQGPSLALTPKGDGQLRSLYEMWLDGGGKQAFGDPLDHGDTGEPQGDVEVEDAPVVDDAPPPIAPEQVALLIDGLREAKATKGTTRSWLIAAGVESVPADTPLDALIATLTPEQAQRFGERVLGAVEDLRAAGADDPGGQHDADDARAEAAA